MDRITIRENVDLIRLQKQLSEKSVALRVMEEKFTSLQQVRRPSFHHRTCQIRLFSITFWFSFLSFFLHLGI